MTKTTWWNELPKEDKQFIVARGADSNIRPEFVRVGEGGKIFFTLQGYRFYQCACDYYGLVFCESDFVTEKDLFGLHQQLLRARSEQLRAQLQSDLNEGKIEAEWRELTSEYLQGDFQAIATSAARTRMCLDAGPGVIPVRFGKNGHA